MVFRKFRGPNKDDQLVIAIILSVFLIATCFYFWQRAETNSGYIDFEDMPSRQAVYLVNVNSAEWPEFANLPGIGEKLAKQIVQYRRDNGPFNTTEELTAISGIGPLKLNAMRPHLAPISFTGAPNSISSSAALKN